MINFFTPEKKRHDPTKLDYIVQQERLMTPQERLKQINETKKEQKEFANWKDHLRESIKKTRIYKNGYRSGILALYTPLNDRTLLYKEEKAKIDHLHSHREAIESKRMEQIKGIFDSSSAIDFHNKTFDKRTTVPPRKIVEKNARAPVLAGFTEDWKDTHKRIFNGLATHIENYSVDRAKFLRNQEQQGRNFNPITAVNNQVEIRRIAAPVLSRRGTYA